MRKIVLIFVLLCFAEAAFSFSEEFFATVLRISDGDTVWVRAENGSKLKIRLLGIDTPEKFPGKKLERSAYRCRVKPGRVKKLGKLATRHARELLHEGMRVKIIPRGRGRYGRILAYVVLPDETLLNFRMIRDGYACVYTWRGKKPDGVTQTEFIKLIELMHEAREEKRGLWGIDPELMECLCGF